MKDPKNVKEYICLIVKVNYIMELTLAGKFIYFTMFNAFVHLQIDFHRFNTFLLGGLNDCDFFHKLSFESESTFGYS